MVHALLDKLSKHLEGPEPVSEMPVQLEKTGALRVDVESYLASPKGKAELAQAQELWEQRNAVTHEF